MRRPPVRAPPRPRAASRSSGRTSGTWWAMVAISRPGSGRRSRTAPRASKVRRPDLVIRETSTVVAGQERRDGSISDRRLDPDHVDLPPRAGQQVGERVAGRHLSGHDIQAGGQGRVQSGPHLLGVAGERSARSPGTRPRSRRRWARRSRTRSAGAGRSPTSTPSAPRARRSARSKARLKSRWLVNRARPRRAYRSRSHCTGGGCCSGWVLGDTRGSTTHEGPPELLDGNIAFVAYSVDDRQPVRGRRRAAPASDPGRSARRRPFGHRAGRPAGPGSADRVEAPQDACARRDSWWSGRRPSVGGTGWPRSRCASSTTGWSPTDRPGRGDSTLSASTWIEMEETR